MALNIQVNKKQYADTRKDFLNSTPLDFRFGFWAMVTEVHPENCTVQVRCDTGQILSGVRVASLEWVTVQDDKHLTGERHLPPVDTYVFCMMPNGEYSSAFVLCSGFMNYQELHADFKEEGEDAANTWEKVENTGWNIKKDYRTGTINIKNKTDTDATIEVNIDQESEEDEKVNLTIHGTNIEITKDDGVKIKSDKPISIETEDELSIKSDKAIDFSSNDKEKILLGNGEGSLGDLISTLIQCVYDLETYGSAACHTVSPNSQSDLQDLKTKWEKVFEK